MRVDFAGNTRDLSFEIGGEAAGLKLVFEFLLEVEVLQVVYNTHVHMLFSRVFVCLDHKQEAVIHQVKIREELRVGFNCVVEVVCFKERETEESCTKVISQFDKVNVFENCSEVKLVL